MVKSESSFRALAKKYKKYSILWRCLQPISLKLDPFAFSLSERRGGEGAGGVIAVLSWTPILPLDLFNYIYLIFQQIIQPINHINPTFFSRAQSCLISCERISAKLPSWSQTFLCVYKNGYIASSPLLFQRKTCIDIYRSTHCNHSYNVNDRLRD